MIEASVRLMLDVQHSGMPVTVRTKQGDTSRKLLITLTDGGNQYKLGADCQAVLAGKKPDGTVLFNNCEIDNNVIRYEFTEQTCAVAGNVISEIRIYGGGKLLTSASFVIEVLSTTVSEDDVISTDEMNALDALYLDTKALKDEIQQKLDNGEFIGPPGASTAEALDAANRARESANTATQAAAASVGAAASAEQAAVRAEAGAAKVEYIEKTAEEANAKVDTLREVVSKFHSNIQETAKGEVITVSDASDLPLAGLKVFGKTEQKTTTGKNLLPTLTDITKNGISFSVQSDGGIRIKGSDTAGGMFIVHTGIDKTMTGTFTFSMGNSSAVGDHLQIRLMESNSAQISNAVTNIQATEANAKRTFTLNNQYVYGWAIRVGTGVDYDTVIYPQLEVGAAATAWEPYTGGIPSPSPEYPQALESVGDVTVTVAGKNLLDLSAFESNDKCSVEIRDNRITLVALATDWYYCYSTKQVLAPSRKYTVSAVVKSNGSSPQRRIRIKDKDGNILGDTGILSTDGATSRTFTTTANGEIDIEFGVNFEKGLQTVTYSNVQLEIGSTATAYEPYKGGTLLISTPNGLPGIWDSGSQKWICDEVDFEKGVYVQRVEQILLDGSEEWMDNGLDSTGTIRMLYMRPHVKLEKHDITLNDIRLLSDCFTGGTRSSGVYKAIIEAYNYLNVTIRAEDFVSIDDWVTSLAKSPIELMFVLAEENPIPLSDEQLAAFAQLHSSYPSTTVFNDKYAVMEVKYVADTKLYIDKKFNELAAALVSNV